MGGEEQHGQLGGKKKVALVVGYCGTDFQGMQMNPGAASIEAELEKALYEAGCIKGANYGNLQKVCVWRGGGALRPVPWMDECMKERGH